MIAAIKNNLMHQKVRKYINVIRQSRLHSLRYIISKSHSLNFQMVGTTLTFSAAANFHPVVTSLQKGIKES
jgi:hypothetical protein